MALAGWLGHRLALFAASLLFCADISKSATSVCFRDIVTDGFGSIMAASGGDYDPSTVSLEGCATACSAVSLDYLALEEGSWCSCASLEQLDNMPGDVTGCNTTCGSGEMCGGVDGLLSGSQTVHVLGGVPGTVTLSINAVAMVDGKANFTAQGNVSGSGIAFLVDAGDGSPAFPLDGTVDGIYTSFSTTLSYLAPGKYTVSVTSVVADGSTADSSSKTATVTVTSAGLLLTLECPPLIVLGHLFHCDVAAGGSADYTITLSTNTSDSQQTVLAPEVGWSSVGTPPPRVPVDAALTAGAEGTFTLGQPFVDRTRLRAIRWLGAGAGTGTCQLTLMKGSCSTTGHVFCASTARCSAFCPLVADSTRNFTCDATRPIFCPRMSQCSSDETASATCPASSAPTLAGAAASPIQFGVTNGDYGEHLLSLADAPIWAEPGWFAKVVCTDAAVAYLQVSAGDGDIAASDDRRYLIEVLGIPAQPISVPITCGAIGVTTYQVSATGSEESLQSVTTCQVPVQNATLSVLQRSIAVTAEPTPAADVAASFSGAFMVRTGLSMEVSVRFAAGGPITVAYTFGTADIANQSEQVNVAVSRSDEFSKEVTYVSSGEFTVRVTGSNRLTPQHDPAWSELTLIAQHPVLSSWVLDMNSTDVYLVDSPTDPAHVQFEMKLAKTLTLPTDASMTVDFGDGFEATMLLKDSPIGLTDATPVSSAVDGYFIAPFSHSYSNRNNYTVTVDFFNRVSREQFNLTVLIEEKLVGLVATVKQQMDDRTAELETGSGADNNEYRNDRNMTFTFAFTQGTIHNVTLFNDSDSGHVPLKTFTFTDQHHPEYDKFIYYIGKNQEIVMSFVGQNSFETSDIVPVRVVIRDPISRITLLKVTLDEDQPADLQQKNFTIDWVCASTMEMCLKINYGNIPYSATYGDIKICEEMFPGEDVSNQPTDLELPMKLSYLYNKPGIFNMSIELANSFPDRQTYEMVVTVSDLKCRNPVVQIIGASRIKEAPPYPNTPHYLKSQDIVMETKTEVACDASSATKKRWELFMVTPLLEQSQHIMYQMPYWDKSDLVIPSNWLQPGLHMLLFTVTVVGIPANDLFQTVEQAYFVVDRTPLHAALIHGSVSKISKGWKQQIVLDAMKHSTDPDDPESKDATYTWYCGRSGETLPRNDTGYPTGEAQQIPTVERRPVPSPDLGGCFGEGPGLLAFSGGRLDINAAILQPYGQSVTFEFTVAVAKDTRTSDAVIQIEMFETDPPSIQVQCSDPLLCMPSRRGATVNRQRRLGLRGECTDYCTQQMTWSWSISKVVDNQPLSIPGADKYMPVSNESEVSIAAQLFTDHPDVTLFYIGLEAMNGIPGNSRGFSMYYLTVNQPPVVQGELCKCSKTGNTSLAVIDTFSVICQMPTDPDDDDIGMFSFFVDITNPYTKETVRKVLGRHKSPSIVVRLGYQLNELSYEVVDVRGGLASKDICSISTEMPTKEQFDAFMASKVVKSTFGTGDSASATLLAQAIDTMLQTAPWMTNLSGQQLNEHLMATAEYNTNMLETMSNMAMNTKESQAVVLDVAKTVASFSKDDPSKLDMRTLELEVSLLSNLEDNFKNADYATPEEVAAVTQTVMQIIGAIYTYLASVISDENCEHVSVVDIHKAPLMPVENLLNYDEMPEHLDYDAELRCNAKDNVIAKSPHIHRELEKVINTLQILTLEKQVLNEETVTISEDNSVVLTTIQANVSGMSLRVGDADIVLPEGFKPDDDKPVAISATRKNVNSRASEEGADSISKHSNVISLDIRTRDLTQILVNNLSSPISLSIPQNSIDDKSPGQQRDVSSHHNCSTCPKRVNASESLIGKRLSIIFSEFNITKPHSGINIYFYPVIDNMDDFFVLMDFGRMPTLRNHSLFRMISEFHQVASSQADNTDGATKYKLFMDGRLVNNRQGKAFVGVGQFNSSSSHYGNIKANIAAGRNDFKAYTAKSILRNDFTTDYFLKITTSSCSYFDEKRNIWAQKGLEVVASDEGSVTCTTSHLTSFASGLFVQPNTIDFAYVFANASFTSNMTIYMTVILLLTCYFLMLIWAHWQDKKDIEKLGSRPLPDNKQSDKYLYEIMLFTGHKSDAATDSIASFLLSGQYDETDMRTFGKPNRRFFRKSGQDAFVMSVPRPLGPLEYLRIWHDNSGKGRFASWFLQYVLVRDVQTGELTTFVCNEWLAVEYGDGMIDRVIAVAGKEQLGEFSHLFSHASQQTLSDGHLWFSVFLRPSRSRFTRMQRVSSCFSLLFLSMLVSGMWYDTVPSQPTAGSFKFGPLSLSPAEISVGVLSNIIVFIPSLIIVFLFRKARPRKLRPSRIDEAMKKLSHDSGDHKSQPTATANELNESQVGVDVHDSKSAKRRGSAKVKTEQKRKLTLPWWTAVIAWILCIVCVFGSASLVASYGIMFGNEKTTKWITAMFASFFSSVLLLQPMKVFLSAMLISAIFKNIDLGSDDANEDEEDPNLANDEEWLMGSSSGKHSAAPIGSQYDKEVLQRIRKQRQKEIETGAILREIISYAFFLWILFVLSYDNRDPNAFLLQSNLRNAFIKEGDLTNFTRYLDFSKVRNTSAFWYWSRNVIMQELRAQTWYDGVTQAYGLRGFLDDRVNRIMGYAMIRQIRSRPSTCPVHKGMQSISDSCQGHTNLVYEDKVNYCANWTRGGSDCDRMEYRYTSAGALQSLPHIASQDVYGGGGYVYRLAGRQADLMKGMRQLEEENWIDKMTRAVFVEFSVYNAQVNLFGVVKIFVEVTPGGGMTPGWRFDGLRLTRRADGAQTFILVCEITYCLFMVYFVVREIRLSIKMKKKYFHQYGTYAEWAIILLSFSAFIVYIIRYITIKPLMDHFKNSYGNGYVNLQHAQLLDDLYGYMISIVVFIATLKFMKLLRFNRRIGMLSATLRQTWSDLTGFFVIFDIAIGSFGLLFNLLLVSHMDEFKNWVSSVEACFAMMLGKFSFMDIYVNSFLAAMMFFLFALYMNLIFVNVLLTIILKGFQQVKNDLSKQPNDYEVVDYLVSRFKRFFSMGENTVSPLKSLIREHEQNRTEVKEAQNVKELPDKVSQFLDQVNRMYFDGNLDLNDKKVLKKTLKQVHDGQRGDGGSAQKKRRPKLTQDYQSRNSELLSEADRELDDV